MTLIKDLSNEELEDLVLDLSGRLTLTEDEVGLFTEAQEEYERRN